MPLTLTLDPALEQRLLLEAQISGLSLETWLAQDLKSRFQADVTETVLLQRITLGLPESFWLAYRALIKKRDNQTLTAAEQLELIAMSDQTEELTLQRTEALLELAHRRNTTLEALRLQFGLQSISIQS
jgi:hypothetical protein